MVPEGGTFDLVTGSPPYTPVDKGVVSPHPQRAACRMELRGSVFDYCTTAARLLKPDGTFVFVHAAADPRPEQAIEAAGLVLNERRDILFRDGRPPTISVFRCSFTGSREDAEPFVMRTIDGAWGQTVSACARRWALRVERQQSGRCFGVSSLCGEAEFASGSSQVVGVHGSEADCMMHTRWVSTLAECQLIVGDGGRVALHDKGLMASECSPLSGCCVRSHRIGLEAWNLSVAAVTVHPERLGIGAERRAATEASDTHVCDARRKGLAQDPVSVGIRVTVVDELALS